MALDLILIEVIIIVIPNLTRLATAPYQRQCDSLAPFAVVLDAIMPV